MGESPVAAELSPLARSFALVNDLGNRPRKGESRRLPVLSLHTESGGGGDEIFAYLRRASRDCPHALLPTTANDRRSTRQVIFDVYDSLTWYQQAYGVLPLPRFGLLVLGIISLRGEDTADQTQEELEAKIRLTLASPSELADSLTRLGLSVLSGVGGIPGVTDAAVDVTTALASRSIAYARWVRATKDAVGLADHIGRTADSHRQVLRVVAWLVKEIPETGGVKKSEDEGPRIRAVDRALCKALMSDLRDAFTTGPGRLRLLRPGRVLIEDLRAGTAPEQFCRYLAEIRAEWRDEDAFDPLLVIAMDARRPAIGTARLATASYDDWAGRSAGQLHRDDAWRYEVAVGGLDDLDVIRLLTAAGPPMDADTADRVLTRTGGNLTAVRELIHLIGTDGPAVLDDPIDEGAPS